MKNKVNTLFKATCCIILIAASSAFVQSCYLQWLADFDAATSEYESDLERCAHAYTSVFNGPALCKWEAGVNYDNAINIAGAAYEKCLG